MGTNYSLEFMLRVVHDFEQAYPRATELLYQMCEIGTLDVTRGWRNSEKNWIKFKIMTKDLARWGEMCDNSRVNIEELEKFKRQIVPHWEERHFLTQRMVLDMKQKRWNSQKASNEGGCLSEETNEGTQLLFDLR